MVEVEFEGAGEDVENSLNNVEPNEDVGWNGFRAVDANDEVVPVGWDERKAELVPVGCEERNEEDVGVGA